ncbi:MAG: FHA domain-containing protein [Deltaproteobacteria bacterium]|nr:FHA domain-containing protein [Deltaproteobacteria bacterium]
MSGSSSQTGAPETSSTLSLREPSTRSGSTRQPGLLVIFGPDPALATLVHPGRGRRTIGRQADQTICLADAALSRAHAEIDVGADAAQVRDLGSHNGTYLNGVKLGAASKPLVQGDLVRCGNTLLTVVFDVAAFAEWPAQAGGASRELEQRLDVIAPLAVNVLIEGEVGSGRRDAAQRLHRLTGSDVPLVVVDAGATLSPLERARLVYLENLSEIDPGRQAELWRLLQARRDLRLFSQASEALVAAVERGEFRRDLFERLAGARVRVPALRERREDLVSLVQQLLRCSELPRACEVSFDAQFVERLWLHSWPGNMAELRRVLDGAVLEANLRQETQLRASDLPLRQTNEPPRAVHALIERQLSETNGNVAACAAQLKMSRRQIYQALKEMGRTAGDFRQ